MSVQPKKYEWAVHVDLDGAKELFKSRVSQPAKTVRKYVNIHNIICILRNVSILIYNST